jgi:hypothetical protein
MGAWIRWRPGRGEAGGTERGAGTIGMAHGIGWVELQSEGPRTKKGRGSLPGLRYAMDYRYAVVLVASLPPRPRMAACAAARRAIGTRYGEQET